MAIKNIYFTYLMWYDIIIFIYALKGRVGFCGLTENDKES